MGFLIKDLQTCKLQLSALRVFKTAQKTPIVDFLFQGRKHRGTGGGGGGGVNPPPFSGANFFSFVKPENEIFTCKQHVRLQFIY